MTKASVRFFHVAASVAILSCGLTLAIATAIWFLIYIVDSANGHSGRPTSLILTDELWFAGFALIAATMIKTGMWVWRGGRLQVVVHHPIQASN